MSDSTAGVIHRHGRYVHAHPHARSHRHLWRLRHSQPVAARERGHHHGGDAHDHSHGEHDHSHGLADPSIVRSRAGVKAVSLSLAVLLVASLLQLTVFLLSNSVALLADLIHNFGDPSTAIPLGIAFFLHSFRTEKIAGLFIVATIFVSACVALYETIQRFIHPHDLAPVGIGRRRSHRLPRERASRLHQTPGREATGEPRTRR